MNEQTKKLIEELAKHNFIKREGEELLLEAQESDLEEYIREATEYLPIFYKFVESIKNQYKERAEKDLQTGYNSSIARTRSQAFEECRGIILSALTDKE